MNGFGLTEAQEMLRREAERFAQKEIAPGARERDKREEIPRELWKKLGDSGLLGLNVPEKYGGQPADWVSLGVVVEEIGKADPLIALIPLFSILFNIALEDASEAVRKEWVPRLVSGEKAGCFSLTEPDCGSDAGSLKTRAIRKGDYYIFNGEKTSVTFGMPADVAIMFAKTDPSAPRGRGVSCFLVPLNLPGITRSKFADMGLRAAGRASIIMDDVKVPAKYLIGEEGKGFKVAMEHMDFLRVGVSLAPLSLAATALEETMNYARQRTAFGKPIAKFEGVSYKIAEAATLIETGKLLCYRAFWMMDNHIPNTKEVAMCKWWCPWVASKVIHDCLLIFGHVGYCEEYAIERRLRDVIGFEMADGTADVMKIIVARELLGREFLPY